MTRLPYAAVDLVLAVEAAYPDGQISFGDLDGFDVYRSVTFDEAVSRWLAPLLDQPLDWRLDGAEMFEGLLTVHFAVSSGRADLRGPWVLPPPPPP